MSAQKPFDDWLFDYMHETGCYAEPKNGERIEVVLRRLIARVEHLEGIVVGEELLRMQHPSLQDAWEQYQTIKGLVDK